MSDERGRGAGDGGRPRDPDESQSREPESGDAAPAASAGEEPEFGSADWLLQQLRGGRPVGAPVEPTETAPPERPAEPAAPVESDEPARQTPPFEPFPVGSSAEPEPVPSSSEDAADSEPAPFDALLGRAAEEPARAEEAPTEFPVAFNWNLTPGQGGDPLVEADREPDPSSAATPSAPEPRPEAEPEAPVTRAEREAEPEAPTTSLFTQTPEPPVVPAEPDDEVADGAEPFTPPMRRSNYIEPVTGPASTVPTLGAPVPEVPAAAGSWVIEPALPTPTEPDEPEPPRTIFDAPAPDDEPASDGDQDQSHGLAALLGFGAPESDEPSGRSVIGDTTSVIPLDPAFRMPEPTPTAEPTPEPGAPEPGTPEPEPTPPQHELPSEPPVLPADDDQTGTPTRQLDTAEIAALLRAEADEPRTVLPSEPAIPAAEAEVALGGIPSPATSPIDAQSIAEASEPDGLAQLFGDTLDEPEDDDTSAAGSLGEPEPLPEQQSEPEPQPEPEPEPAPEPAAETEGPQLVATTPFTAPPSDARSDRAPADVDGATITAAAASATSAASAAGLTAAPAAAAVTVPPTAAPSDSVASAATPPPAAPASPGLWGSRNNRILFTVVAALAVVLVLIGLFALGTRIPSWFGAAKPAAQTAASATPSAKTTPTPTPTPVPTVTPKPAAAVGPGVHPWDSLGGGECIQPFTSVWAEDFTVVDCATPHTAQLVYTNLLSADPAAPYPGADALAQQVPGLCIAGGVVDLGAAGAYPDVQVIGSFPATEQQWKDGQRSYYCFASRVSGQPLTSSVAGPGPS